MKNAQSVNWNLLLDERRSVLNSIQKWAVGTATTREVSSNLTNTQFSSEFRKLVRNNGTVYGRRLARKALRYRGLMK